MKYKIVKNGYCRNCNTIKTDYFHTADLGCCRDCDKRDAEYAELINEKEFASKEEKEYWKDKSEGWI